ncbi:MAG: cysteine hydrolase [Chloroflexi bacterium]|nr:cysteine hydrolase [Chloroflexota bacterium]
MMSTMAFLIIDAQQNMFEPDPVHNHEQVLENLQKLVTHARATKQPLIFLQNCGRPGDPDQPHTPGWKIHPSLQPVEGELILQKETPDAFLHTNLHQILQKQGIDHLIVAGMQTEMCVDTAVRVAHNLSYKVTVAADAHSTFDGVITAAQAIKYHNDILSVFADVKLVEEIWN